MKWFLQLLVEAGEWEVGRSTVFVEEMVVNPPDLQFSWLLSGSEVLQLPGFGPLLAHRHAESRTPPKLSYGFEKGANEM